MNERAAFAYIQARLQAQHGRRPNKSTWRRLNASKTLGHYLENVRQTSLAPWVTHFTANSDIHMIEQSLRQDWKTYVTRLASWAPQKWRASILSIATLVELPHKTEDDDETPPPPSETPPLEDWLEGFLRLWPNITKHDRRGLEQLLSTLRQHLSLTNPALAHDAVEARYALSNRLERLFRQGAQGPVAVFAFVGLVALDLEHLRAHLVHRRLFPETLDIR